MPSTSIKRRIFEPALTALLVCVIVVAGHPGSAGAAATSTKQTSSDPSDDLTTVIDQLNQQVSKRKTEISQLKDQMASYQSAIEQKRQEAASVQAIDKNDQHTAIDLFLTQKTLSDFFNDAQFLEESQRDLKDALDSVQALKASLESQQAEQSAKKVHLADIQKQLKDAQDTLTEQRGAKAALAEQLQVTQSRYQYDLAQLQKEVNNANNDIAATERRLRKALDESKLRKIAGAETGWMWPVPSMIITTYFHDPDYPFRYIFEHPAIDIRASQGTPVRASKGGYVARAKDAGMGYSYVMIVHDDGLSTVYGHVSKILVKEDTYVDQGDVIALSGGTPGTPGAGPLTTAAHLHFEIRQDGIPVDPLNFLQR